MVSWHNSTSPRTLASVVIDVYRNLALMLSCGLWMIGEETIPQRVNAPDPPAHGSTMANLSHELHKFS
jgi:hypothetical protein